jgi:hypothetical protein
VNGAKPLQGGPVERKTGNDSGPPGPTAKRYEEHQLMVVVNLTSFNEVGTEMFLEPAIRGFGDHERVGGIIPNLVAITTSSLDQVLNLITRIEAKRKLLVRMGCLCWLEGVQDDRLEMINKKIMHIQVVVDIDQRYQSVRGWGVTAGLLIEVFNPVIGAIRGNVGN